MLYCVHAGLLQQHNTDANEADTAAPPPKKKQQLAHAGALTDSSHQPQQQAAAQCTDDANPQDEDYDDNQEYIGGVSLFGPNGSFAGGFGGAAFSGFSGFGDYGASAEPRQSLVEQLQEAEQGAERSAVEAALTAIQQVSSLCACCMLVTYRNLLQCRCCNTYVHLRKYACGITMTC
jgi:hypothetical protein